MFRKTFKIQKTWTKSQPTVISTAETFDDGNISPAASPVHLHTPSPSKDPISSESQQQAVAEGSNSSSGKKSASGSRELRGILENMPSLRNSPLPAHRRIASCSTQSTSSHSRTIKPKNKESGKKADTAEKQEQKLPTENQLHASQY